MRGRAGDARDDQIVHDVHLHEPLVPVGHGADDRRIRPVRLLDDLAGVVDDAPAPIRALGSRDRCDLHGLPATTAAAPISAATTATAAPVPTAAPATARARGI